MSKKLTDIRKKIDTIDNKIHDLIMERASLVGAIAKEKAKNNLQTVHPAREAKMIRRLLDRHEGPLPKAAVVRIWRELVGAVSLLQSGLKVVVFENDEGSSNWDMAKNFFGSVVPMQKVSSPLLAVASVRENTSSFAVLPWPNDDNENLWWAYLLDHEPDKAMRVVGTLPYGVAKGHVYNPEDRALVVSRIDFSESGDDHSFLILEVDNSVSRARIVDVLKEFDKAPLSLFTKSGYDAGGHSLHMVEVPGFVDSKDKLLQKLSEKFDEHLIRCIPVGGYAVPPVYDDALDASKAPPLKARA